MGLADFINNPGFEAIRSRIIENPGFLQEFMNSLQ